MPSLGYEWPTTKKATCSPTTCDLHWAAGMIEGEGSFSRSHSMNVRVGQKNLEPLYKLLAMFGGNIILEGENFHSWSCSGKRARGVAQTLYVLLSKRRQEQIRKAMNIK